MNIMYLRDFRVFNIRKCAVKEIVGDKMFAILL